jgi:hypothetical protein
MFLVPGTLFPFWLLLLKYVAIVKKLFSKSMSHSMILIARSNHPVNMVTMGVGCGKGRQAAPNIQQLLRSVIGQTEIIPTNNSQTVRHSLSI